LILSFSNLGKASADSVPDLKVIDAEWGTGTMTVFTSPDLVDPKMKGVKGAGQMEAGAGNHGPSQTWTQLHFSPVAWAHQYGFSCPTDEKHINRFFLQARNFRTGDDVDVSFNARNTDVMMQDKGVVERIVPAFSPESSTEEVLVKAAAPDYWADLDLEDLGLKTDRYIQAIEIKPIKGVKVIHHAVAQSRYEDESGNAQFGLLEEYAVGKFGDIYANDTGRLIKAGTQAYVNVHLHASGKDETVQMALGIVVAVLSVCWTSLSATEGIQSLVKGAEVEKGQGGGSASTPLYTVESAGGGERG